MLNFFPQMAKTKRRPYKSLARERQAEDTRRHIVAATRQLLQTEGYARMTSEAIADQAEVSPPSVYAIFKSKAGILAELLDESSFGPDDDSAVQQARTPPIRKPDCGLPRALPGRFMTRRAPCSICCAEPVWLHPS